MEKSIIFPHIPSNLPVEILCTILSSLERNEIEKAQLVDKQWDRIIKNYSNILPLRKIQDLCILQEAYCSSQTSYMVQISNYRYVSGFKVYVDVVRWTITDLESQITTNEVRVHSCWEFNQNILANCIVARFSFQGPLQLEALLVLKHMVIYHGQKIRAINLFIGVQDFEGAKLEALREIFENLMCTEVLSFCFKKNELQTFLDEPKNLYIPNSPKRIELNFDVSSDLKTIANFLTSEEIFGAERYFLRLGRERGYSDLNDIWMMVMGDDERNSLVAEKIREEEFWEQLMNNYKCCINPNLLIRNIEFTYSSRMSREILKFLEKRHTPCQIEQDGSHVYKVNLAQNWKLEIKFSTISHYDRSIFLELNKSL